MARSLITAALLVVAGGVAATFVIARPASESPPPERPAVSARGKADGRSGADAEQRLRNLEARLVEERTARRQLEDKVDALVADLAARRDRSAATGLEPEPDEPLASSDAANAPSMPDDPAHGPVDESQIPSTASAMERALAAAGIDADTAADIKRRQDAVALAEIYLRDQATRENWLDTPRFEREMEALEAEQLPLRDEIGDDAYDRYLYALGHANRVRIDDVLVHSPAAQAGLQPGDMIVRYGDDRIFVPGDLIAQTRTGLEGETVRLQVIRNGVSLEVEVPRGPLGLRVASTQASPDNS